MKKTWSKNKSLIAVILVLCIGILMINLRGSHMLLTVKYSGEASSCTLRVNSGKKGYVREHAGGESVNVFSLDNFQMKFSLMEISFEGTAPEVEELYISSRNHVLFRVRGDKLSQMCTVEASQIVFSQVFLKKLNQCSQNDWFLKLELIVFLLTVLTVTELALWLNGCMVEKGIWRWLWECIKRYRCLLSFLTAMLIIGVFFYGRNIELSVEQDREMEIPGDVAVDAVSTKEESSQEFYAPYEITAIQLRFATYQQKLGGSYELRVYDAAGGEPVETVGIDGSRISDNQYISLKFAAPLPKDTMYRAVIAALDERAQTETLAIWTSSSDVYEEGAMFLHGEKADGDWCFRLERKKYGSCLFSISVALLFLAAVFIACFGKEEAGVGMKRIAAIYSLLLLIFLLEMIYQRDTHSRLNRYDENAQISFIAYIAKTHEVIPTYEEAMLVVPYAMKTQEPPSVVSQTNREGNYRVRFSETVNYLGHPPLYYWLMAGVGKVRFEGDAVILDMSRLRTGNMMLVLLSTAILLYIGASRIDRTRPELHLLYGGLIVFMPLLSFEGVTVNNDNLNVLAVALFMLGALRFTELKRDYATYFLIAAGICTAMLTKVTAGLVLFVAAGIFLVRTTVRDKSLKAVLSKEFAVTLPLYLIVFIYFVLVFAKYGTFQPRLSVFATEQFLVYPAIRKPAGTWKLLPLQEYFGHFISGFLAQWGGAAGHRLSSYVYKALWFVPVLMWLLTKKWDERRTLLAAVVSGMYFAVLFQIMRGINSYYYSNGRVARQSRYYVCMIGVMALLSVTLLEELEPEREIAVLRVGKIRHVLTVGLCLKGVTVLLLAGVLWGTFLTKLVSS